MCRLNIVARRYGSNRLDWYRERFASVRHAAALLIAVSICVVIGASSPLQAGDDAVSPKSSGRRTIDTSGFRDSAGHWRHIRDESRFIKVQPGQSEYAADQIEQIVGNIILFQRANGGWPKDYDMLAVLTDDQKQLVSDTHDRNDTSYDNHNIHTQVNYLAKAYSLLGSDAARDACLRGFDFIVKSQYTNGGIPQRFPDPRSYAAHITFNDGVMIGVMNLMQDVVDRLPHWEWLDDQRREQARQAIDRGIDCILKCQIRVEDVRTGWCQQHDRQSFEAMPARTFELASICPQDTTEIIRFLMRQKSPSAAVIEAVDDSVKWLNAVKLSGIRLKRIQAPAVEFLRHDADFDIIVEQDANAGSLWARHYEIGTNRPIFAGRDGIKRYQFSEIERERRTGTAWYGGWPLRLLDADYPRWRETLKK